MTIQAFILINFEFHVHATILDFLDSLDSLCTQTLTKDFIINSEFFIFLPFQLSSLSSRSSVSVYRKVKGSSPQLSQSIIASSQLSHPLITAGQEGKPSGKESFSPI